MEIKIDTKKDSREDIKHVIMFLQRFIQETSDYGNEDSGIGSSDIPTGAMGMFDSTPADDKKEDKDDDARIQIIEY